MKGFGKRSEGGRGKEGTKLEKNFLRITEYKVLVLKKIPKFLEKENITESYF